MGKSDPDAPDLPAAEHDPGPAPTPPASRSLRDLPMFGYRDRLGHGEVQFTDVRVPVDNMLGDEGDGFAIAQGRLGPGRMHYAMRAIGMAERALELMCRRARAREAFGGPLAEQGVVREWIARSRMEIDQIRLLILKAAWLMDTRGNAAARTEVAAIKVAAMEVAHRVVDRAVQTYGAAGVSDDTVLARLFAITRALQIADGPNEVHLRTHRAAGAQEARRPEGAGPVSGRMSAPTTAGGLLDGKVALVTGATRGLGRAIAHALAEAGATVIVSSRKADACERGGRTRSRRPPASRRTRCPCTSGTGTPSSPPSTRSCERHGRHRHPGQQRRHRAARAVGHGRHRGALRQDDRRQPQGPVPADGRGRRQMVRGRTRVDHQHLQHRRRAAQPAGGDVRGVEERAQRAHAWRSPRSTRPHVRVNCVMPGAFATDMASEWDDEFVGKVVGPAAGRAARGPRELAGMVVHLASDAAGYTTGALIPVDGGRTAVY